MFDSSTGFTLPNKAVRSPDASLVLREKWEALPNSEKKKFAHICPDFVIEIISTSDNPNQVKAKMEECIAQGASLGWLIDFDNRQAWVYKAGGSIVVHPFDRPIKGEYPVAGFELSLSEVMKG